MEGSTTGTVLITMSPNQLFRLCRDVISIFVGLLPNTRRNTIQFVICVGAGSTRIVRGSDYSPASELFARVRQTMTGNNPKLDLVNVDAHKKIGQILTICSQGIEQKQNSDINQGPKLC